jgi:N-acetylneuraminic acid mutarotase
MILQRGILSRPIPSKASHITFSLVIQSFILLLLLTGCKKDDSVTNPPENNPTGNGTWTQRANFPGTSRGAAIGFSLGTKVYVGLGNDGSLRKDFWEYTPATDSWNQKADFGGSGRSLAIAFSIDTKGYVGTGSDGSMRNDFWEYDPATNAWTQRASVPGGVRMDAVGFSIGSKGYVGTGFGSSSIFTYKDDFWEYDPASDHWTAKANFPGEGRWGAIGFAIGGKGYVGTGFAVGDDCVDFWEYDPATDKWTAKAVFPGPKRSGAFGFSIGSKGYVGTGSYSLTYKDLWEYDPGANVWTQKMDFAGDIRDGAIGCSIGSTGFVGTGVDSTKSGRKDFWQCTF